MVFFHYSWPERLYATDNSSEPMVKRENRVFCRYDWYFLNNLKTSSQFQELLFYSKLKVLQIFEILSTLGASYDKISLLWFLAKFWWKFFHIIIQIHQNATNLSRFGFLHKLCEEPQDRDFVVRYWKGIQNLRNDLNFSFRTK